MKTDEEKAAEDLRTELRLLGPAYDTAVADGDVEAETWALERIGQINAELRELARAAA